MNKAHPLYILMQVHQMWKKIYFDLEIIILGSEVPYLSAICALIYFANNTRPDIVFLVNLLAIYSSSLTKRHWNRIKHILRYLRGIIDMKLFYSNKSKFNQVGFVDFGYLSDPYKAKSQSGYLFTYEGTTISWRSMKQTITTTTSNHAEILAIHEASTKCIWLRSMTQHIREPCGLSFSKLLPTKLYKDKTTCIT